MKIKKLNINDSLIDVSHDDELFDNKLPFIEFNHDALKNQINEKISFTRELNIWNQLFVCWLNKNKSFFHDLSQNNELLSELSQNEDLSNYNDAFDDENQWKEKRSSTTFFFFFIKFNEKKNSINVRFYLIRCKNEFTKLNSYVSFSIKKDLVSTLSKLVKDHEELRIYESSKISIKKYKSINEKSISCANVQKIRFTYLISSNNCQFEHWQKSIFFIKKNRQNSFDEL